MFLGFLGFLNSDPLYNGDVFLSHYWNMYFSHLSPTLDNQFIYLQQSEIYGVRAPYYWCTSQNCNQSPVSLQKHPVPRHRFM